MSMTNKMINEMLQRKKTKKRRNCSFFDAYVHQYVDYKTQVLLQAANSATDLRAKFPNFRKDTRKNFGLEA